MSGWNHRRNVLSLVFQSLALCLGLMLAGPAGAADGPEYNRDIRPILAEHCLACHGADEGSREADLRLDDRVAAIEAGAIVEGDASASEMIARILTDDPDLVMPPVDSKKPLTAEQKQLLQDWVQSGATYQSHWAFLPPQRPAAPSGDTENWAKNPIDRFVLSQLNQAGLQPAGEAAPRALFRRLHLDITGLPPAPQDVDQFVQEYADGDQDVVWSRWIDQLMSRSTWGEHRARYWLDAARYGDTHGLHFDNYREMWPYRDWVIRAFNANQPFDQFTVEQLAGDLLPDPTDEQLIATGFQRCNITTNEGGTIDEENMAVYAADRVQTFGWVYLGLTTNCGQCHDHKFDPFTMKDYYSLAAYFRNTTQPAKDGNSKDGRGPILAVPQEQDRPRWQALPPLIEAARQQRDQRDQAAAADYRNWLANPPADLFVAGVPTDGLVAHLPLEAGQGRVVRDLLNSDRRVEAAADVEWVPDGIRGAAPVFSEGAAFEVADLGDIDQQQAFSVGGWIRASRKDVYGSLISRMDSEENGFRGWDLWQDRSAFAVHFNDHWPDNAIKMQTRGNVIRPDEWQHVFMTYDGSGRPEGIRLYVNGRNEPLRIRTNTLAADATLRTTVPMKIGGRSHGQEFQDGAIQQVLCYDRMLHADEVRQIASLSKLQDTLDTAPESRSDEEQKQLREHYLARHDVAWMKLAQQVMELESEQEAIRVRSPITHIQQERTDTPAMAHVLMRGAYDKPGEQVAAATPVALHAQPEDAPPNRLGLAQWVVQENNPLTARVTVNRFWQEVFGQGLVVTPEDFGVMGAKPSHPELLDWLAVEFRESGWDVKHLFRLMLSSATYRQAAVVTSEKLERDRDNRLLSRGPRFRMDAEMVRDSALAASGLLSTTMYGPGTKPYQPEGIWDVVGLPSSDTRLYRQDNGENLHRRTLYTFWKRMAPPPNLEAFNAPSREYCVVRRERTNTPLQALVTLNDPQFMEAAVHLAHTALTAGGDDSAVLDEVARRVLARSLNEQEQQLVKGVLQDLQQHYQSHPQDAAAVLESGRPDAPGIPPEQLAAWTMLCNQMLNLDEALNK